METLDEALRWRDEAESTTATVWEVEAADDAFAGMLMLERSGELGPACTSEGSAATSTRRAGEPVDEL